MLAHLVRSLRTLDDVGRLFVELGYVADDQSGEDGLRPLARWRTFHVLGVTAREPRGAARTLALRLGGKARPALVVALGDDALALAAPRLGVPGSSPVLSVHTHLPEPFALRVLADLAPRPDASALEHALRVADALASEEVGTRFFTAFRALLDRMTESLGPRSDLADRMLAALLPLTRVLFLYFVQAKGWLDGRPDFLRDQLDQALADGRDFHRSVLHPLFFGTLNRPPAQRSGRAAAARIPYLNGGLIEPHPVERRLGPIVFPNSLWRDAFDDLFERFRFCVREGGEVDAIAPDMLGRVFEGVMDPRERQASGTFYTPERLVRQLVVATLATTLANDETLTRDGVAAVLRGEQVPDPVAAATRRALTRVRVLDPAAGSGAFLLGALDILTAAWQAVLPRPELPRGTLRRRILRNHLFGVDVSPVAVRLAELRLWLAVIADDREEDVARVAPLPNLQGVVRQGDSLLDPLGAARAMGLPTTPPSQLAAVRRARLSLFDARGPERSVLERALRDAELRAAAELADQALARTRAALRDLAAAARDRDLFGGRAGLARAQQHRYEALRRRLRELRAARRRIGNGTVPFFAFEVHRPDVQRRGGFTLVVGNPPWVRAERLPGPLRTALSERFTWWRASAGTGFTHQPDLAVAFLERALELTAPGGAVGMLVPSKIASAGYAERARAALVRDTTLEYVCRVSDHDATAFGAAVYPLALVARKRAASRDAQVALDFAGRTTLPQHGLEVTGPWVLRPDRARRAIACLRGSGTPLGTVAHPVLGVKTGADSLLVGRLLEDGDPVARVAFADAPLAIEQSLLRPAVRGRDLRPFGAESSLVVFWAHEDGGRPLSALPPHAGAYVRRIRRALLRRADYRDGPPWTLFRLRAAAGPWRVVWPDIARSATAVALDEVLPRAVPLNTCYAVRVPERHTALVIAAILNSTWTRALVRVTSDEARGGYRRHNGSVMARVPVPHPGPARTRLVELSHQAHRTHDVDPADLDAIAAEALQLPADARDALADLADDPG